jgi:hypothetical protein
MTVTRRMMMVGVLTSTTQTVFFLQGACRIFLDKSLGDPDSAMFIALVLQLSRLNEVPE